MTFDPDDPRLTAFALGELDEADQHSVEALLADSPEAARYVAEVRETAALLSGVLGKEPTPGLSIVHRLELEARLGEETPGRRRFPVRRVLVGLAAGILFAVGGFGIGMTLAFRATTADRHAVREEAGHLAMLESQRERVQLHAPSPDFAVEPEAESLAVSWDGRMPASSPSSEGSEPGADQLVEGGDASGIRDAEEALLARSVSRQGELRKETIPVEIDRVPASAMIPPPSMAGRGIPESDSIAETDAPAVPSDADRRSAIFSLKRPAEEELENLGRIVGRLRGDRPSDAAEEGLENRAVAGGAVAPETPALARALEPEVGLGLADREKQEGEEGRLAKEAGEIPGGVGMMEGMGGFGALAFSKPNRVARIEPENVVEVVKVPEGELAQRISLAASVEGAVIDPTGNLLLATTSDRLLSVFEVESGRLVQAFKVDQGPMPVARFNRLGEVVLSNVDPGGDQEPGEAPLPWFSPEVEPVAAIPVDPGTVSVAELDRLVRESGVPIGPSFPVASLVNAPAYPYDRPEEGEAVAVDVRVVPTPWAEASRLVRIALIARESGDEARPIAAEGVAAEVEFNPARVAGYRPIGFAHRSEAEGQAPGVSLADGASCTVLFEIKAEEVADRLAENTKGRAFRYQAPAPIVGEGGEEELLTVSLSYQAPGEDRRITREFHIDDRNVGPADVPDDVRLAAAMAWLGLIVQGSVAAGPSALEGIEGLIRACDDGFLPDDRGQVLDLIDRIRGPALAAPE